VAFCDRTRLKGDGVELGRPILNCKYPTFVHQPGPMAARTKILVPVVGYESAGKSTLIDALLGGEYTQTSSLVCTRLPYHFTLRSDNHSACKSAAVINKIISEHNAIQAPNGCIEVELDSHYFDVKLRLPLCFENMKNVDIEVIDLPGWKENIGKESSSSHCLARAFVKENWDTFGCVLVVLDVTRCNGEAQERNRNLLRCLKEQNEGKNVDIVIVGNKSDLDDAEGMAVKAMKRMIEAIFGSDAMDFIPVSAKGALFYRYAAGHSSESFERDHKSKMETIKKLIFLRLEAKKKNNDETFDALVDKEQVEYQLSSESSNFARLLEVIENNIGGEMKQRLLLERVEKNSPLKRNRKSSENSDADELCCEKDGSMDVNPPADAPSVTAHTDVPAEKNSPLKRNRKSSENSEADEVCSEKDGSTDVNPPADAPSVTAHTDVPAEKNSPLKRNRKY
jgi:GTPase SAR1 family protein